MECDYYAILEVTESATLEDIRKQARKKKGQLHPDKAPQNERTEAEQKFKQVSEAAEVLSNPERKAEYDRKRKNALGSSTPFSNFFYGSGNNNTARTKLSPEEEKFWDEMDGCNSRVDLPITCSLEELFYGAHKKIQIGAGTVDLLVPAGSKDGDILNVDKSSFKVFEQRHHVFARDNDDLIIKVSITLLQAFRRETIHVPTIEGTEVAMDLIPVTAPSTELMLQNYGMPKKQQQADGTQQRGRLKIKFNILYPEELPDKDIRSIEQVLATVQKWK